MADRVVSPSRRRIANLLAMLVVVVLGVSVWQSWDFWRELAGFPPARRARHGRNFYYAPGPPGRAPYGASAAEGLDWELRDRVRLALEIEDDAAWAALEPKVSAVVRLQRQLPEPAGPLAKAASARLAGEDEPSDEAKPPPPPPEQVARTRLQLKQAQDELRKSVTRRQEASLVLLGLLD